MAAKLTFFISSTVKDFGGVRSDLRSWLRARGIDARLSENHDFPVDPVVTSHDACLRAVADSHVMILLIGDRYGGRYEGTRQSITWREYDEARTHGIPVVALVLRRVNEAAERWSRAKREVKAAENAGGPVPTLSEPPFGRETDDLIRFIDAVRKGHLDNWMHEWDGSVSEAKKIINERCNALFVAYQTPHTRLRRQAELLGSYATARHGLELLATSSALAVAGGLKVGDAFQAILKHVERNRDALLGFEPDDRYNVGVYEHRSDELSPIARCHDARITPRNRVWKVGEGHIGLCFQKGEPLISPDLKHTASWVTGVPSDEENYVSAVAVPIHDVKSRTKQGVLVVTSSRKDHFRDPNQIEVLTTQSLALTMGLVGYPPR